MLKTIPSKEVDIFISAQKKELLFILRVLENKLFFIIKNTS